MATATKSYASQRNAIFKNTSSNLVDLVQRYQDTVAGMTVQAQRNHKTSLKRALAAFRKNNPGLVSLNLPNRTELNRALFPICRSIDRPLSLIYIDTTMQRQLDLDWVCKIITFFRAYQAQPIQVYYAGQDRWGGWDGQHTALALYLIAVHGLGMQFEDVVVPVNEYSISTRGQLRSTFISNNSVKGKNAGKKPLDEIDRVEQMIYGVECDGVTDSEWVVVHEKWKYLRDAGMFLTADKFGNTNETGAIGRLQEFDKASQAVIRQFAVYGEYVIQSQATSVQKRPINAMEIPILIEFFNACELDNVLLSDDDIRDLAQHCIDLFDANFDARSDFWKCVYQSIVNSWIKYNKQNQIPKTAWGKQPANSKNTPQGYSFFWHQLSKTWAPVRGVNMPKRPSYVYTPDTKDLMQ